MGASRVVLARELTLDEIKMIRKNISPELELEAFIHGSMCVSYSGRCLLSNYLIGRDANRGMCAQPCRWNYTIEERNFDLIEEKRPDIPIPVRQINGETFIMSSKDMCMIEHIPELMESGINSFKIEGRMKSAYYTAVVTNAYRMAIEKYKSGNYEYNPLWLRELESVSHREYSTGYFFDRSDEDAKVCENTGYLREKSYLATVISYNEDTKEAFLIQKNKLTVNDKIELLSPMNVGVEMRAGKMYNENHESIESAPHAQMKFYMEVPVKVKAGDIIRSSGE
jgi:putative protease